MQNYYHFGINISSLVLVYIEIFGVNISSLVLKAIQIFKRRMKHTFLTKTMNTFSFILVIHVLEHFNGCLVPTYR